MPYAHITVLPDQPVGPSIFWDAMAGATIKVFTLFIDGTSEEIGTTSIIAPEPEEGEADNRPSYATIAIEVNAPDGDEFHSSDLRVEIWNLNDEGILVLLLAHTIAHNFIFDTASPYGGAPIYFGNDLDKVSKGYIFLPLNPGGYQALVREDGHAAPFDELLTAVKDVVSVEKINGQAVFSDEGKYVFERALTYQECLRIAQELIGYGKGKNIPKPGKPLKKIFKFKEDDDGSIDEDGGQNERRREKREQFEGDLKRYYSKIEADAKRLAKDVYTLFCALWANKKTREVTRIQFLLPTVIPDQNGRELLITNLPAGHLEVDTPFFYALGVNYPEQVNHQARYEQAIVTEQRILIEAFVEAKEKQIISQDYSLGERKQVVRKFRAIDANLATSLPEFQFSAASTENQLSIETLMEGWASSVLETSIEFWENLSIEQLEGHNDLLLFLLVAGNNVLYRFLDEKSIGNQLVLDQDTNAPYTVEQPYAGYTGHIKGASHEDWQYIYFRAIANEVANEAVNFLPNGNRRERADFFALHAFAFFNQNVGSIAPELNLPPPRPIPYFASDDDPISRLGIDFDNPPSQSVIDDKIRSTLPHDACAQDWLRKKVQLLLGLHELTASISPKALQQTARETLYALGITDMQQLTFMSSDEFKACVVDTIFADSAGNLTSIGKLIDESFVGSTAEDNVKEFSAINPGNLINCQSPKYRTKLGEFAYLKDLLASKVNGETVSSWLKHEYNGLSFDELIVQSANVDLHLPSGDLCNRLTAQLICPTSGIREVWALSGITSFIETLCDYSIAELKTWLQQIKSYLDGSEELTLISSCFANLVSKLLVATSRGIKRYLDELVGKLVTLEADSRMGALLEGIQLIEDLPGNPIASPLAECIDLIVSNGTDDVQSSLDQLSGLTNSSDANPIAVAFINMLQEPVHAREEYEVSVWETSIGNTNDRLTLQGQEVDPTLAAQTLQALPAHWLSKDRDCAYEKLANSLHLSCQLPYHFNRDVSESYLNRLDTNRFELARKFGKDIHAFSFAPQEKPDKFRPDRYRLPVPPNLAAQEYLGISQEEFDQIYARVPNFSPFERDPSVPNFWALLGFPYFSDFAESIFELPVLLDKLCLDCCEFDQLLRTEWIEMIVEHQDQSQVFSGCQDCELDKYLVSFPDAANETVVVSIWKLYMIAHLYRQLRRQEIYCYSFKELTLLIDDLGWMGDDSTSLDFNPQFLEQFVAVDMLRSLFGICPFFTVEEENICISSLLLGPTDNPHWEKTLDHLLDGILRHCNAGRAVADCRPATFKKLLAIHIDKAAALAGFSTESVDEQRWYHQFTNILRFTEQLSRICNSSFSFGQLQFILTADEQLVGDDPVPQQTRNEAQEYPFDFPDKKKLNLAYLREKLLAISLSEDEIKTWNWGKIVAHFRSTLGYQDVEGNNFLFEFMTKFFPGKLMEEGYIISNEQRQFRVPIGETSAYMFNTGEVKPIQYDPANGGQLFASIPLITKEVLGTLQSIRQLNTNEEAAIQKLLHAPARLLAPLKFIFRDPQEAERILIEGTNRTESWFYFQQEVAYCMKACDIITTHLTDYIGKQLGKSDLDPRLTQKILVRLYAGDNFTNSSWEHDSGEAPPVQWPHLWQAGAFAALLGVRGIGLFVEYSDLENNEVIWRELFTRSESHHYSHSKAGCAVPGLIPAIDFNLPSNPAIATVRNGFAFDSADGDLLGAAQGWQLHARALIHVASSGLHQFSIGAPTPDGERPDIEGLKHADWSLRINRGYKTINVLDHNWEDSMVPADCSTPIQLEPGMYEMNFHLRIPQVGFSNLDDDCPNPNAWAIKWITPTIDTWSTIRIENLYQDCPVGDLSKGLSLPAEVAESLSRQYVPSIVGQRASYIQAISAGLLLHGFGFSATSLSKGEGSEVDYLLDNPHKFSGLSYYHDASSWNCHLVHPLLYMLPIRDNYCLTSVESDQRRTPTPQRIAAWFDYYERLWEIHKLKSEANALGLKNIWHLWQKCTDQHQPEDIQLHLQTYLGIAADWYTAVTHFHPDYKVSCKDLENEVWSIRVWEASKCIRKWKCALANIDFAKRSVIPAQWINIGFDEQGHKARTSLVEFIADALINNSQPPRFQDLKAINASIREREASAIRHCLSSRKESPALIGILDYTAANCREISRVAFSIQLVQAFLHRVQLNLGQVSLWKPTGIIKFLKAIPNNGNLERLREYLEFIKGYFSNVAPQSAINQCFHEWASASIDYVHGEFNHYINEMITEISSLEANTEGKLFEVLVATMDEITDNPIAKQWARCIQTFADSDLSERDMAIWEVRALMNVSSDNPIAAAFAVMIPEPLSNQGQRIHFREKEYLHWEKRLSSYAKWHSCQLQDCYPEDYAKHEITAEDRRSSGFRQLEEQIKQQVITRPVSGGASWLGKSRQPSTGHLLPLQERQTSTINASVGYLLPDSTPPEQNTSTSNYPSGQPQLPIRSSWRSVPMNSQLSFWLETARHLGQDYIRVPAAGIPAAELSMNCSDTSCCHSCEHEPYLPIREYFFWLIDSTFYPAIRQKCEDWMGGIQLAELLHYHKGNKAYLAFAQLERGKLQQMGWSSDGIVVTDTPKLKVEGRYLDSLYLSVKNGIANLAPTASNGETIYDPEFILPGFRFDLATNTAVILPQIDESLPIEEPTYWFAYHDLGAPLLPKHPAGTSLLVAEQLQLHCHFLAAKEWLDLSLNPMESSNTWQKYDSEGNLVHQVDAATVRNRVLLFAQLKNIQQWITHLHQSNTQESLAQAGQLVSLAEKIMGPRPKSMQTTKEESISLIDFEPLHPGLNRRLLCLYDSFADQKALLDHCLNAARVSCYSVQEITQGTNCVPKACRIPMDFCIPKSPYRFRTLLNSAKEYAGQLTAIGNALLAAFEKGEQETLSLIQQGQAKQIADQTLKIKKNLVIAADWRLQSLEKALEIAKCKLMHFTNLKNVGLIAEEQDNLSLLDQSMILQAASQVLIMSSQAPNVAPTPYVGTIAFSKLFGGEASAKWIHTGGQVAGIAAGIQSTRASKKGLLSSFARRLQEWEFQVKTTQIEIKQIEIQILEAQRQLANTQHDLDIHQLQIEHAQNNLEFLRTKFTGEELYNWQRRELAQLYRDWYEATLKVAYQAQMAANIEQGYTQQNWLQDQYWDNFWEGLLAGPKLSLSLQRMEQEVMNQNHPRYELSTSISLREAIPRIFLQLRHSDSCMINLPEELFAKSYPSHYCRTIRYVEVTIPCVVGPYSNINCTLTLKGSKVRISPRLAIPVESCPVKNSSAGYLMQDNDERFVILPAGDQSMATSHSIRDNGYHNFDPRNERKLFFENAGVAAQFCLEIPADCNQFDKRTISDVVLGINYTAKEGGAILGNAAKAHVKNYLPGNGERLLDLSEVRPDDWYQFLQDEEQRLAVQISRKDFSFITASPHELFVDQIELFIETTPCPSCDSIDVYFQEPEDSDCIDCDDTLVRTVKWEQLGGLFHGILPHYFDVQDSQQLIGHLKFPKNIEVKRVYLLLTYGCKRLDYSQHHLRNCGCDT